MELMNVTQSVQRSPMIQSVETVSVRRATAKDIQNIYKVACSVGSKSKESYSGFLMDDYASNPKHYQKFFLERVLELDHFYIAENQGILGFLMAYTKEQWLKYNPTWIEAIYWNPKFDMGHTDNFIVIDKTAILSHMTGKGIGSILYKQLMKDLKVEKIYDIFAETIINPTPNFASLAFREKQKYTLAGMRYEDYNGVNYTDLIYHKPVK